MFNKCSDFSSDSYAGRQEYQDIETSSIDRNPSAT